MPPAVKKPPCREPGFEPEIAGNSLCPDVPSLTHRRPAFEHCRWQEKDILPLTPRPGVTRIVVQRFGAWAHRKGNLSLPRAEPWARTRELRECHHYCRSPSKNYQLLRILNFKIAQGQKGPELCCIIILNGPLEFPTGVTCPTHDKWSYLGSLKTPRNSNPDRMVAKPSALPLSQASRISLGLGESLYCRWRGRHENTYYLTLLYHTALEGTVFSSSGLFRKYSSTSC